MLLRKNKSLRYDLDNIPPILLPSNIVKVISNVVHLQLSELISRAHILSSRQGGFRQSSSIFSAHVNHESRIRFKDYWVMAGLVTLEITKACDSVGYGTLISRLVDSILLYPLL